MPTKGPKLRGVSHDGDACAVIYNFDGNLDAARENRLVHVQGKLVDAVGITEGKSGAARTVGRLAGTNLLVDRPASAAMLDLYEGRLLPPDRRAA